LAVSGVVDSIAIASAIALDIDGGADTSCIASFAVDGVCGCDQGGTPVPVAPTSANGLSWVSWSTDVTR
jgi:hypothetical protein